MSVLLRNARVKLSTSTEDGDHDVSDSVTKVMVDRQFETVDLTTIDRTARFRITGREEWSFEVGLLQAFSTESGRESGKRIDQILDILAQVTAAGEAFMVHVLPDRSLPRSANNPEYQGLCVLSDYAPMDGAVGDLLKITPKLIGSGALVREITTEDDAHGIETIEVMLSESEGRVVVVVATADTLNIRHTDVAFIEGETIPKIFSETLSPQVVEISVIQKTFPITGDTVAIQITDVATVRDPFIELTVSESDESSESFTARLSTLRGGATLRSSGTSMGIHLTELRSVQVSSGSSDTVAIQISESATLVTTFPYTPVLSAFTGGDEDPLSESGNWAGPIFQNMNKMKRVSNGIMQSTALPIQSGASYWNAATFGPGSEARIDITTLWQNANSDIWLWLDGNNENAAGVDGYMLYIYKGSGTWDWAIYRVDNGTSTQLGAALGTQALSDGDSIGFQHRTNGTLQAWYKASAGSWAEFGSIRTDTTYSSGHIGVSKGYLDSTSVIDNFGGGTAN